MARKMNAAVVEQFGKPLCFRNGTSRLPGRTDPGQDRGLRRMPHGSPCRTWRLADQTHAPVHSWP